MHMLRKRNLRSDEMGTLRRSRKPATVVTANGEVQTNEEAQVFAHDLDLFVTVQVLDDTSAVLSHRKLCEENGYTYECPSGQKPHLTKQGKKFFARWKISYLLLSLDYPQILVPVRLLHRHRRTHQVHLQSSNGAK